VMVGRNAEETVNGTKTVTVGSSITLDTGSFIVNACKELVLKAPGGTITIGASGIKIESATIDLKGKTAMSMGMPAQVASLALAAKDDKPLVEPCKPS
jgi:type VI secretion system secreted protein VgrG